MAESFSKEVPPNLTVASLHCACALDPCPVRWVAAVDVAYEGDAGRAVAAAVVYDAGAGRIVEERYVFRTQVAPYVPGALALREGEIALAALRQLASPVEAVLCDAHGRAHPRRFGLACWLEERLAWPVVGCAKRSLVGSFVALAPAPGAVAPLEWQGEVVGAVVRTRFAVRPVFVSSGGRWSLDRCVRLVLRTCAGFRIPEPLRAADQRSRQALAALVGRAVHRDSSSTIATPLEVELGAADRPGPRRPSHRGGAAALASAARGPA